MLAMRPAQWLTGTGSPGPLCGNWIFVTRLDEPVNRALHVLWRVQPSSQSSGYWILTDRRVVQPRPGRAPAHVRIKHGQPFNAIACSSATSISAYR